MPATHHAHTGETSPYLPFVVKIRSKGKTKSVYAFARCTAEAMEQVLENTTTPPPFFASAGPAEANRVYRLKKALAPLVE